MKPIKMDYDEEDLHLWFGLSYASFLVLSRVCMMDMSEEWQRKMAKLLNEYDETFPNKPDISTTVRATDKGGNLIKMPEYLKNYRHPNREKLKEMKGHD